MNPIFSSKLTFSTRFTIFWANIFLFSFLPLQDLEHEMFDPWSTLILNFETNILLQEIHFLFYLFRIFSLRSLDMKCLTRPPEQLVVLPSTLITLPMQKCKIRNCQE